MWEFDRGHAVRQILHCSVNHKISFCCRRALQLTVIGCVQYGEFRSGFDGDTEDTRLVAYGIQYIVENFVAKQWTMDDLDKAAKFFRYAKGGWLEKQYIPLVNLWRFPNWTQVPNLVLEHFAASPLLCIFGT